MIIKHYSVLLSLLLCIVPVIAMAAQDPSSSNMQFTAPAIMFVAANLTNHTTQGEVPLFNVGNTQFGIGLASGMATLQRQAAIPKVLDTVTLSHLHAAYNAAFYAQQIVTKLENFELTKIPASNLLKSQEKLSANLYKLSSAANVLDYEERIKLNHNAMQWHAIAEKMQLELSKRQAHLNELKIALNTKPIEQLNQLKLKISSDIHSQRGAILRLKAAHSQLPKHLKKERLEFKKQIFAHETELERLEALQCSIEAECSIREFKQWTVKVNTHDLRKQCKAIYCGLLRSHNQNAVLAKLRAATYEARWPVIRDEVIARTYNPATFEAFQHGLSEQLQQRPGDQVLINRLESVTKTMQNNGALLLTINKQLTPAIITSLEQHGVNIGQYRELIGNSYQLREIGRHIDRIISLHTSLINPALIHGKQCSDLAMRMSCEAIDLITRGSYLEVQQFTAVAETLDRLAQGKLTAGINIEQIILPGTANITETQRHTFEESIALAREIQEHNLQPLVEFRAQLPANGSHFQQELSQAIDQTLQHPDQQIITERIITPEVKEQITKVGGNPTTFEYRVESAFEHALAQQCYDNVVNAVDLQKTKGASPLFLSMVSTTTQASVEAVNQIELGNYHQAAVLTDAALNISNLCTAAKTAGLYGAHFTKGAVFENAQIKITDYILGKYVETFAQNIKQLNLPHDPFQLLGQTAVNIVKDLAPTIQNELNALWASDKPLYAQMISKIGLFWDHFRAMSGLQKTEFFGQVFGTVLPGFVDKIASVAAESTGVLPALRWGTKTFGLDAIPKQLLRFIASHFREEAEQLSLIVTENIEYKVSEIFEISVKSTRFEAAAAEIEQAFNKFLIASEIDRAKELIPISRAIEKACITTKEDVVAMSHGLIQKFILEQECSKSYSSTTVIKRLAEVLQKTGGQSHEAIIQTMKEIVDKSGPGSIWSKIKPTQGGWNQFTFLPKSFEIEVNGQKLWVSPNGAKHLMETVTPALEDIAETKLLERSLVIPDILSINARELLGSHTLLLEDFYSALSEAIKDGIIFDGKNMTVANGWEFIFSKSKIENGLPVIKHARRL